MTRNTGNKAPAGLHVIIIVRGGVAHVLFKPPGIALSIYDYDCEDADPSDPQVSRDPGGDLCYYLAWPANHTVLDETRWPVIPRALKGRYSRTWQCPKCDSRVDCSYEDLAQAGVPICTNCDMEMELQ